MKGALLAFLLALIGDALAAGAVITSTSGLTTVQAGSATPRTLRVGDQIAQGDTVVTTTNSSVVLKFDDGQVIALTSNSRFQISAYQYNPATESGNVLLSLVAGGFRAITGLIGRRSPNQVAYRAAAVTISIRGTDSTIATSDGNVVVAISDGAVKATFQSQSLAISAGEAILVRPDQSFVRGSTAEITAQAPTAIQQALQQQSALIAAVASANPGSPPQGQQGEAGEGRPMGSAGQTGAWSPWPGWWPGSPWTVPPSGGVYTTSETVPPPNAVLVEVLFATDRSLADPRKVRFGVDRSPLRFGICEVSIPLSHKTGELEGPTWWQKLVFRDDPEKHVVLQSTALMRERDFLREVSNRVGRGQRAFVFVHGYNVTFEDAARRTAQIHYDLQFDGAPVFFSWPSQGSLEGYGIDEQNNEWAQSDFKAFLADFFRWSQAEQIYVIAHSMGTRVLARALTDVLRDRPEYRERIREIVLAAPDIDADVFKREIAPRLAAPSRPLTLYASSTDLALKASKSFHGYPRAGESGASLIVTDGVETIDATDINVSFLGHSTFAESRSALSDMFYLITQSLRPDQRHGLRAVNSPSGKYWVFVR